MAIIQTNMPKHGLGPKATKSTHAGSASSNGKAVRQSSAARRAAVKVKMNNK